MACLSFFVHLKQKEWQLLPVIIVLGPGINSSLCVWPCSDEGCELLIFMLVAAWPNNYLRMFTQESDCRKVSFIKATSNRHSFLNLYLTKLLIRSYQLPVLILIKDLLKLHISGVNGLFQLLNLFRENIEYNSFPLLRDGLLLN